MSLNESKTTDNHEAIKKWVEERDGAPALMGGITPEIGGGGMLRIDFKDNSDGPLNEISWETFFEIFDESNMLFLYQEKTEEDEKDHFYKIINKD